MSDFPSLTCRIAFGSNALDARPSWTDVSADMQQFSIRRGRQFELDRIEPGQAFITLRNLSGAYWPDKTDGPHSPNVRPGKRIEVTTPAFQREIEADGPAGYWRLDEADGSARDSSGAGAHGTIHGDVTQGRPGLLAGNPATQGAYAFDGQQDYVQVPAGSQLADIWDGGGALVFVVYPQSAGSYGKVISKYPGCQVYWDGESDGRMYLYVRVGFSQTLARWHTTDRVITLNARNVVSIHYNSDSAANGNAAAVLLPVSVDGHLHRLVTVRPVRQSVLSARCVASAPLSL